MTDKQRAFLARLLDERDASSLKLDLKQVVDLSNRDASFLIDKLLACPRIVQQQLEEPTADPDAIGKLPAGRYAIENEQGELRFYQLWVSKDGKRRCLYVLFGDAGARLFPKAQAAICEKILARGIRECAVRFGEEIGACSKCGRRLTNRISRSLGIGPICGGKMFGEVGWVDEVRAAREALISRGLDPDEDVLEDEIARLEALKKEVLG